MIQITLAALHLLALPLGLAAVVARAAALRAGPDTTALHRALRADALWGVAALLWLGTGLWRWLGGVEMPAELYTRNPLLHVKLGLFAGVFALEIWPMITLLRWRRALTAGASAVDLLEHRVAQRIARISAVQAVIVVGIVFVAAALARGYGLSA